MNIQNLGMKFTFVAFLIACSIWVIGDPERSLKKGIDLAGGHSLLYEIDTSGLADAQIDGLSEKIIKQLRKRVDPLNQRNLIWRPIGDTRLEIQMPSSTGESTELRNKSDEAMETLLDKNITRSELFSALSLKEAQRDEALKGLVRGVEERSERLEQLVEAFDHYEQVRAGAAEGNETEAFKVLQQNLDRVLETNLSRSRLVDVFDMDAADPRQEQLDKLKEQHPAYAAGIDQALVAYDAWSVQRGMLEGPEDLKQMLRGAGVLEFRIIAERDSKNPSLLRSTTPAERERVEDHITQLRTKGPKRPLGQNYRWFPIEDPMDFFNAESPVELERNISGTKFIVENYADRYYVLAHDTQSYGLLASSDVPWKLESAIPSRNFQTGEPIVSFELDPRGGDLFGKLTKNNKNRALGIFLDEEVISAPNIRSEIHDRGMIEGNFSQFEANALVNILEAGSLPARLKEPPLSERSIGPSLGQTNLEKGLLAAIMGLIIVAAFMLVYYLLAGLIANVALALNVLLILAAMSMMQATFTLPGIAALILTVGMAVDANVLIFERIREELARGMSIKMALKNGYEKAFSTIFDANLTTLITCVILGYSGSEEVKGFALVLGLGVVFSMFTALFVTRIIFAALVQANIVKSIPMLRLLGTVDVNWLGLQRIFGPVSLIVVIGSASLYVYEHRFHKFNIYDIEFLGGTSVTVEFLPGSDVDDEQVRQMVSGQGTNDPNAVTASGWLRGAADKIPNIQVSETAQEGVFLIKSDEFTDTHLESIAMVGLSDAIDTALRGIEVVGNHTIRVTTKLELKFDLQDVKQGLQRAADYFLNAANNLSTAKVQLVYDLRDDTGEETSPAFEIITTEPSKEVVRAAILAAFGDRLRVEQSIEHTVHTSETAPNGYYPIHSEEVSSGQLTLSDIIEHDTIADVSGFEGGVAIVFEQLSPPQTEKELRRRFHSVRLLPDFEQYSYRPFRIVPLEYATSQTQNVGDRKLAAFALLVADENIIYEEQPGQWEQQLAIPELKQAQEALRKEKSLQKVTQFAPQIAKQTTERALMAIVLALLTIVLYIWIRFGTMRFGLAAIVALVHDVIISLGAVAVSYHLSNTTLGELLGIQDFKIDLPMIAAFLTIVGYSLNDTIVVFDRIRENRGKLKEIRPQIINTSINQTISRTLLTSTTTLLAVIIMYIFGGDGIHGFSFAMIIGVVVGTYSSIAIAAPLLQRPILLKWIIHIIMGLLLVGSATSVTQPELKFIIWSMIVLYVLFMSVYEWRRWSAPKPE